MIFVVQHAITDPEQFWNVLAGNPAIPENFELHAVLPGTDASKAVCIWKAPDQAQLESLVSNAVGPYSHNSFMQVNEKQAMGLPA